MSNRRNRHILITLLLLCCCMTAEAQRFCNLTADEVRIDSFVPRFATSIPLGENYADSVYTVSILYPEFIDITPYSLGKLQALGADTLSALPVIESRVVVERKKGFLEVSFVPFVFREGQHRILVSFMLDVKAAPITASMSRKVRQAGAASDRYAAHSVLSTGRWAKVRVSSSGIYQINEALARQAGFSDLSKVRIYGYGGALQNEKLEGSELKATDDLMEVPTCMVGGRRLFYAQGPVSWSSPTTMRRTRNPYSDYGYYFITEAEGEPLTIDSISFVKKYYPRPEHYHTLHEVDNFSWFQGGRNLFENNPVNVGESRTYTLSNPSADESGQLAIALTAGVTTTAKVELNGTTLGSLFMSPGGYDKGAEATQVYKVSNLHANDTITITTLSGGPVRLDYIDIYTATPRAMTALTYSGIPAPEYVYTITNQDLHGDGPADMVIIIPTSQKLLPQAQRIAQMHEQRDNMRVRIVPADELFNEFSSGTPDANAYRRYLKMLYDRAGSEADMPKYLLLFGDGFWDNRMLTSDCRSYSPDDFLLCFESEESFSEIYCYVDDGFFGLLDDGEGVNPASSDKLDIAVGRFPVHTIADAKTLTDKTINYAANADAGAWQNQVVVLGDDGNNNSHLVDADNAANLINSLYPGFQIKKIIWDAYTRVTSATGNTYPDCTRDIKQIQSNGALLIDYSGHGSAISISHERVLVLQDFKDFTNTHTPLWITASCDIMPFDMAEECIGVEALLNKKGGAMAFFGTTRTVYQSYNAYLNRSYMKHVLNVVDGKPVSIGEAQRLAKNEMITSGEDRTTNKLRYSLLGDPALCLHVPTLSAVVDSINGVAVGSGDITLRAGATIRVSGHVELDGKIDDTFNGLMTATVRDSEETVICKGQAEDSRTVFSYIDRPNVLFNGSDSVSNGTFHFTFAVPMDINYTDGQGLMNIYAVNNAHTLLAHGACDKFRVGGTDVAGNDYIGPSIYCYLNTPSFVNGGDVNSTPYFVAQITDKDGINAAGTGIGHDLELIIDNEMARTYVLNDHFAFDFGSYTSGTTYYSIPELAPGRHNLRFRAWDVLNNSSTAELSFNVVSGLRPTLFSVSCTNNPASTSTTFIINHDRTGSEMDVELDIYDLSGRLLWQRNETGVSTTGAFTIDWDLTVDGGRRLQTGVYVYRVRVACDGSSYASKAKKLIIVGNK
ncbi:MAG: type IX secretion system sortase PorU [Prevotella sp.]|nr:type IX secretion system sortase PorU [Prevotella sp.]